MTNLDTAFKTVPVQYALVARILKLQLTFFLTAQIIIVKVKPSFKWYIKVVETSQEKSYLTITKNQSAIGDNKLNFKQNLL